MKGGRPAAAPRALFDGGAPYFTIDPGRAFLADLARAVAGGLGCDPAAIADAEIFVPTRRAARALGEAFRREAAARGAKAVLLPRIRALGDVDEDEIAAFEGAAGDEAALAPAATAMERKLVLARMVAAKDRAFAGQESWPAALSAAGELAALLDSFYTEEIAFDALDNIVPQEFAAHWGEALKFLEIVGETWPAHLAEIGRIDPADRRVRLINLQTERWTAAPPQHPVVVAGTTGSAPSVARLMRAVAAAPRGAVVLPGLDRALAAEKAWKAIDDPHPQAGMKALLRSLEVAPGAVAPLPRAAGEASPQRDAPADGRASLLSLALRPAEATDDWRALVAEAASRDPGLRSATKGLALIDAPDEEAEASAIAILMRETLEAPGETAMLVTPDRDLSRRVSAKMRRWGVVIDDSAGVPFANSPCGTYLRLVADWLAAPENPVAAIALARHPLAMFGVAAREKSRMVDAADEALRGLAPSGVGVEALARKIERARKSALAAVAAPLVAGLARAEEAQPRGGGDLAQRLKAHVEAAEILAADNCASGAERLWRGRDGDAGAALVAGLVAAGHGIDAPRQDYPGLFTMLISGAVVRRPADAHPRLAILGPLEARLQSADRVILGGLNEGVWPADAGGDPFLSRPMRKAVGLPSPERRIGLAAHDFAQLAAGREVFLTRAARSGGAPTKPSRWLLRLRNILNGAQALASVDRSAHFAGLARALDAPACVRPAGPPVVRPPAEARLSALHVTRVGQLLRDPYGVYASQILKLRPLDALGEPFAARHLGELFHAVFERFARAHGHSMPRDPNAALQALFETGAREYGYGAREDAFWRPAVAETLCWFARFHADRLAVGAPAVIEDRGEFTLTIDGAPFALKARADRIDLRKDGMAEIFDYKSKKLPSIKQTDAGFAPQLPLTALIAAQGGFADLGPTPVAGFANVRVLMRHDDERKNRTGAEGPDAEEAIADAHAGLCKLIRRYNDPDTPFLSQPRPEFTDDYGDYDHLARRREWSAGPEEP